MAISKKQAAARGEQAIERPKGAMEVTLFHGRTGVTMRYQGKVIVRIPASVSGRQLAPFAAQALGVPLPALGAAATATVSSGVMFRVLSIASLDLRNQESFLLLDYLLQEARELRSFHSEDV